MGLSAPMADRPYSGFSYSSERTTKHMIRGADIGASIDTVIMPYTRQRGYPCENRNWVYFCVRPENDLVLAYGWKLTCFQCGGEIDLVFVCGANMTCFQCEDRLTWFLCRWSKLTFFVGAENDMVLCGHWNWPGFLCGWSKLTWCQCGRSIDLISVNGSELTCFLCGGRKLLGFNVWIEIVFVSGHINLFDFRVGIKIDLISVLRSKLIWFICGGSKLTWF